MIFVRSMRALLAVLFVPVGFLATMSPGHAAFIANLQLIHYCNDDGTQCAGARTLDQTAFNATWAPAGLTFNVLPTVTIDQSATAQISDYATSLINHRNNIDGAPGGAAPFTLYLGIARERDIGLPVLGGFSLINSPYGLVDESAAGGDDLFFTHLVAHEVGHMLGAVHDGDGNTAPPFGFLMSGTRSPTNFSLEASSVTLAVVQQSSLIQEVVVAVPAPPITALLVMSLIAIYGRSKFGWFTSRQLGSTTA